jgi:DNA-binding NtrC family response regulator
MPASVLIVDPSADNREVLRTALARRGWTILEAAAANRGLELARQHHPNVIVADVDSEPESDTAREHLAAEADHDGSRLIIIGRARSGRILPGGRVVAKPYHFAPLIRTIEQLAAKAA